MRAVTALLARPSRRETMRHLPFSRQFKPPSRVPAQMRPRPSSQTERSCRPDSPSTWLKTRTSFRRIRLSPPPAQPTHMPSSRSRRMARTVSPARPDGVAQETLSPTSMTVIPRSVPIHIRPCASSPMANTMPLARPSAVVKLRIPVSSMRLRPVVVPIQRRPRLSLNRQ